MRYTTYVVSALCSIGILVFAYIHFRSEITPSTTVVWDASTASYLAHRVLLDPTPSQIQALTTAGSAFAAAQILLAAPDPNEEVAYSAGLNALEQSQPTASTSAPVLEREIYTYELIHDPNGAQRKLYYLWENIFSVDQQVDPGDAVDKIDYQDIQTLDQILYNGAYGNYIDLLKQVQTSYAMGKYLNLIGSNPKNPNENYSREVMQLFLMGQYTPLDTTDSTANYSDADVNSLAYLLTGYRATMNKHTVTFDPKFHYNGQKMFLGQNVSFSDPMQAIDYIVTQRKEQISEFLSYKILKYYVSDNPEPQDITTFASEIRANDFNIKPSLTWLFSSPIMYRPAYMQEDRYRSPLELVAAFYTAVFGRNDYTVVPNQGILYSLSFNPHHPGSVFGRPGFDSNIEFFSGSILDAWIGGADRILRDPHAANAEKQFFSSLVSQGGVSNSDQLVKALEGVLYDGVALPASVENDLSNYLSNNDTIPDATVTNVQDPGSFSRMLGVLNIMIAQPEFVMDGGNPSALPMRTQGELSSASSSLVIVRVRGGLDYQQLVANIGDSAYAVNRASLAFNTANAISLGKNYALNPAASAFKPLIAQHTISFITAVGLPGQVRAHDIASDQMETGLSANGHGIGALLKSAEPSLNLVSLTDSPPIFYRGSQSLQMGAADLALYPELKTDNSNPKGQLATLKKVLSDRNLPAGLADFYSQTFFLDELSKENLAAGGKGTPGGTNQTQLPFLEYLINHNIGDVYYLYADDSYDFHAEEEPKFDSQIQTLTTGLTNLFTAESAQGRKLTIVLFSEFGRTDKTNGNDGTDHGIAGGMVVISNLLQWPAMIGTLHPSTDANNWTDTEVDEREVWSGIFDTMYGTHTANLLGALHPLSSYPVTLP
ncbi:MAG: DUF1800 family protein [Candidatus Pacebacteria bacterium]|nr:DUF1800 family protein [Candidatus Paceibacterota bacterium]